MKITHPIIIFLLCTLFIFFCPCTHAIAQDKEWAPTWTPSNTENYRLLSISIRSKSLQIGLLTAKLPYKTIGIELADIEKAKETQQKDYVEKLKEHLQRTSDFLGGLELGGSLAELEAAFNIETDIFNIKEIRSAYDWITAAATVISAAGGILMIVESEKFSKKDSDTPKYIGGAFAVAAGTKLVSDLVFNPKHNKQMRKISTQIAISRKAYDDTKLRLQYYDELIKRISEIRPQLETLHKKLDTVNSDPAKLHEIIKEVVKVGNEVSLIGTSVEDILANMVAQSNYYITFVSEKHKGNDYLPELLKGYEKLNKKVLSQLEKFNKEFIHMFNLINNTTSYIASTELP